MSRRWAAAVAWTGAAAAPLLSAVTAWMMVRLPVPPFEIVDPLALTFPAAGAFLITKRPRLFFPWMLWGIGLASSVYNLLLVSVLWTYHRGLTELAAYLAWPAMWTWLWYVVPAFGLLPLLFPDGRPPSPRWRPLVHLMLATAVGHSLLMAFSPDMGFEIGVPLENPFGIAALGTLPELVERHIVIPLLGFCVAGIASLVVRFRAGGPETRRQVAWFAYAMGLLVISMTARLASGNAPLARYAEMVIVCAIPLSIVVAVLRYRLYDIDVILNRTLVHVTVAVVGGGVYSGLIWLGSTLAADHGHAAGLAAALSAGMVFHPVRLRVQRAVDRLLKVERDPYRAADRLNRTVQEAEDPAGALATATDMVRWALGADGVRVEVDGERVLVFTSGAPGQRPRTVPLEWHGEPVGRLQVTGARPGRESLAVLSRHVAELAHAVRLAADLRRSRERISSTRDEERRRLGRELHDGLGPALTAIAMTLDEARRRIEDDRAGTQEILVRVRGEMTRTIGEVRELVYGLRPPALDDLGLEGALRAVTEVPGTRVDVAVDGPLTGLPAAVEVAAYRIAQEALTNVRRHAGAERATLRLRRLPGELRVEVCDDGVGLPDRPDAGLGLISMRERAAEVGGSCELSRPPGGGTVVTARLPLPEMA
ncbi:sensor histidine kinase [Planomonospora corallina]|uniref:Oxygen sensor histidine kinase NreB n=1 Tax=Planomonospora corallina TaxID=1806052 RepID=A0ABV8IHS1_9ACTN